MRAGAPALPVLRRRRLQDLWLTLDAKATFAILSTPKIHLSPATRNLMHLFGVIRSFSFENADVSASSGLKSRSF